MCGDSSLIASQGNSCSSGSGLYKERLQMSLCFIEPLVADCCLCVIVHIYVNECFGLIECEVIVYITVKAFISVQ